MPSLVTRRLLLAFSAAIGSLPAHARPTLRTFKNPGCACCDGWAKHVRGAGFAVTLTETPSLDRIRAAAGVPDDLAGCHTSFFGDLVAEGHVPAAAITRLLENTQGWRGIAVPGMPIGSPGMEVPGTAPEIYEIWAFAPGKRRQMFARARGGELVDA
jgi:hypothetical protein